MSGAGVKQSPMAPAPEISERAYVEELEVNAAGARQAELLRVLWSQRRLLGRITAAGLLIATMTAFLISNRYTSTARIMPPDDRTSSGLAAMAAALSSNAGGMGVVADNVLGLKNSSDVFLGILQSRTTQDRIIEQFGLGKVYGDRRIEDTRADLTAHTDLSVDRKSLIITIAVTDKDPRRAAGMAQAYAESLDSLESQLSTSGARRERIFLEGRLQEVRQSLEAAEQQFSQFASKNAAIDIKEQGKAMVDSAAAIQGQLIATQAELEGLKQIYTDNNVRVRSLNARLGELKQQLGKIGGKNESGATGTSDDTLESIYPSIRRLPLLGVTYADLYRQTAIQEAVYETLTKEYELAKVQEAKEIPTVKILDPPNIPEEKSFPPRLLIVLLGTAMSFMIAAAWAFGKAQWEATKSSDPRKQLVREIRTTLVSEALAFARNGPHSRAASPECVELLPRSERGDS
jgi:uncharacterized protein involved in exopolysaccharide biosynthesis